MTFEFPRVSMEDFAAAGQPRVEMANGWVRPSGKSWKAHRNDRTAARFFATREEAVAWVTT